jgi:hypothetical protein
MIMHVIATHPYRILSALLLFFSLACGRADSVLRLRFEGVVLDAHGNPCSRARVTFVDRGLNDSGPKTIPVGTTDAFGILSTGFEYRYGEDFYPLKSRNWRRPHTFDLVIADRENSTRVEFGPLSERQVLGYEPVNFRATIATKH